MFLVNDVPCITLKWPAVPRVGDSVDLATTNPNMPSIYVVDWVLWRHIGGELHVAVYCKEEKK